MNSSRNQINYILDYPIPKSLIAEPYKLTKQPASRLHKEVLDLSNEITPLQDEVKNREEIVSQITTAIQSLWKGVLVNVFGSFDSNTYLPMSDIDIVVQNHDPQRGNLHQLASHLTNLQISKPCPQVLTKTKVPLIKMVHATYNIDVDISMNTSFQGLSFHLSRIYLTKDVIGEKGTSFVKKLLANFEMLRPLVYIIKLNLVQHKLHDPYTGGLGSYALILLIVSFLQEHREKNKKKEADLGDLLLRFFEYYGQNFNFYENVVIVGKQNVSKASLGWRNYERPQLLSIQDPTEPSNDVGRPCFKMDVVAAHFSNCYFLLKNSVDRNHEKILANIVNISEISKIRNERANQIQQSASVRPSHRDQQPNYSRNEQRFEKRYERYDRYEEKQEQKYEMKHERSVQYQQQTFKPSQNIQNYSSTHIPTIPLLSFNPTYNRVRDYGDDDDQKESKKRKHSHNYDYQTENSQKKSKHDTVIYYNESC